MENTRAIQVEEGGDVAMRGAGNGPVYSPMLPPGAAHPGKTRRLKLPWM